MPDDRVLVVGTTPDYIAYIFQQYPKRALFLTDTAQRRSRSEVMPDEASEIVCELADTEKVLALLTAHLRRRHQNLSGVACYDCEWLHLAAIIGEKYKQPFPSRESIRICRNKYLTKLRWAERGVRCPRVELITAGNEAMRFVDSLKEPAVLKPLTGSGSELTFLCRDRVEASQAYHLIKGGLIKRERLPMYQAPSGEAGDPGPRDAILAEEFIEGREFSADFMVADGHTTLIRTARKIRPSNLPFGTTTSYVIPARLPHWLDPQLLIEHLGRAAAALDLRRAVCMVDFIVSHEEIVFLELTPRIGGDCLPPLVRQCCGLDTIGLALDFAESRPITIPPLDRWARLVGLRLFADRSGRISSINTEKLGSRPDVREVYLKREPGHVVMMPPEDYDSWLLGHVIFEPRPDDDLVAQSDELKKLLILVMEPHYDQKLTGSHNACR